MKPAANSRGKCAVCLLTERLALAPPPLKPTTTMNDTPTPETDACWHDGGCNILEHARRIERERDEAREQSAIYAAEREHNAMQALAYKAERDEAREALRKAIRFVEAFEPCSRGTEVEQNETLAIARKALEGAK
jgi:hypothetical protein